MSAYDWDPAKAEANFRRRGISFAEARDVAASPLSMRVPDVRHSASEVRFKVTGYSNFGRLLVVIVSNGGHEPRIISARRATKRERDDYVG